MLSQYGLVESTCQGGYDPTKSRVSDDTLTAFIEMEIPEDLEDVPGDECCVLCHYYE